MTPDWRDESFCYITTAGRRTGRPHEIEIWFAAREATLWILAGGGERSDTVRNLQADPRARVRVGDAEFTARGRVVTDADEAALVRAMIPAKYAHTDTGLEAWAETALPVAFDLTVAAR